MKMKSIIAVMLLLSIVFMAGCKPSNVSDDLNNEMQDNKVLDMCAGNVLITEEEMNLNDRIVSVLAEADKRLETAETVVLKTNFYTQHMTELFAEKEKSEYDPETTVFYITSDADRENMQYLLLLHTLTTEYSDYVFFRDKDKWLDQSVSIVEAQPVLYVSDQYEKAGYDSAEAYFRAYMDGAIETPEGAFRVWFNKCQLFAFDDSWGDENLLPKLIAAAEKMHQ